MKLSRALLLSLFVLIFSCSKSNDDIDLIENTESETEVTPNEEVNEEEEEEEEEEPNKIGIAICDGEIQPTPEYIDTNVTPTDNKCDTFLEENGLLIFEAENTKSDFNKWIYETSIPNYRGTGYLRYKGPFTGSSPLVYKFKIQNAGIYRFMIRSSKPDGVASDANNDCFIKMEGDFIAGEMHSCLKNADRNSTNTNALKKDTKFFGTGGDGEFKNAAGQLDLHNVKPWATYNFKAGETYTLTITGRSSEFSMDRILIVDLNKYDYANYNKYAKNAVQNPCVE
ncbi:carbohydrate-binding protein [Lutibacter citreus]|uniref:hypothetical protein n=1 Tax=Lutibacter citreus TaxID=2138210 RepID=UPI000DBE3F0B|nr:hypothetical protein [Lutibacter citreus]